MQTGLTSTSFDRAPAPVGTFVRGKSGYVPFWPGGLDDVILNPDLVSSDKERDNALKTIPPGFTRGLRLPGDPAVEDELIASLNPVDMHTSSHPDEVQSVYFVLLLSSNL